MKKYWVLIIPGLLALMTLACASVTRDPGSEAALRRLVQQEPGIEVEAIQYEARTGTAVVQLRSTDDADEDRLSYRWYVRDGDTWVLAPYVGVKRPDAP